MKRARPFIPDDVYEALRSLYDERVLKFADGVTGRVMDQKHKDYWLSVRSVYGREPFYKRLYDKISYPFKKIKKKELQKRIQHIRAMGYIPIVCGDEVVPGCCKTKFTQGRLLSLLYSDKEACEDNDFITQIPYSLVGTYEDLDLMLRLVDVNMRLREYFDTYPTHETETHRGVSLGYTAVSGGYYAKDGKSGSYHANKNILHDPDLQRDAIEVCCLVVTTTFKDCVWYKSLMAYYDLPENQERKKYLLPGTPCTNIWWSVDSRAENKHVDWNAYGASFLFCPDNYRGGEITLQHNKMKSIRCKQLLKLGQVFAGRWGRGHHYNQYVDPDECRNSFVMYGDSRILEKTNYVHVENKNTGVLNSV